MAYYYNSSSPIPLRVSNTFRVTVLLKDDFRYNYDIIHSPEKDSMEFDFAHLSKWEIHNNEDQKLAVMKVHFLIAADNDALKYNFIFDAKKYSSDAWYLDKSSKNASTLKWNWR